VLEVEWNALILKEHLSTHKLRKKTMEDGVSARKTRVGK